MSALCTDSDVEATQEGSEESEAGQGEDDESLLAAEARDSLGAQAGGLGLSKAGAEVVAVVTRPVGSEAGAVPAEAGVEAEVEAGVPTGGEDGAAVAVDGGLRAEVTAGGGELAEDTVGVEAGVKVGEGEAAVLEGGEAAGEADE